LNKKKWGETFECRVGVSSKKQCFRAIKNQKKTKKTEKLGAFMKQKK